MVAISNQFGSFDALLNLKRVREEEARAIGRLSSGERISRAREAPADLGVSNDLRGEIRALRRVRQSNFEGVSAIQLADETLEEATNLLTRAAELTTQAASSATADDNSPAKLALDLEYQELLVQLDQINDSVKFNETPLFGSAGAAITVNMTSDVIDALEQTVVATSSFNTTALALAGTAIATEAGADAALGAITAGIETISRQRGRLGALQGRLLANLDAVAVQIGNLSEAESQIRDADIADEATALTRAQILTQSNLAVLAQANLSAENVFQLLS